MTDFNFKIAGEAGQGIASAGLVFSKLAMRSGYFVFDWNEYPSLIRGGHNVFGARVSDQEIHSQTAGVDFLIALNQNAVNLHQKELKAGGAIIINAVEVKAVGLKNFSLFPIPLLALAEKVGGQAVMTNNVALGAVACLLGADFQILASVIRDVFGNSKPELVNLNLRASRAGFDYLKKNFPAYRGRASASLKRRKADRQLLLTGNDAIGLGAVAAGCQFFAAYPMTPINSMIGYFAARAKELGMVYYQPEDEIAGINAAIGASHGGARSMVATSGGGFSLMVEGFGLAGMTETPLVIIEGQRPGPSTGLPTWTSQSDLRFVLHASQDDFPRIVLAPGDTQEAFWLTLEAFNLADRYQTPVVLLVDKYLCESHQSIKVFDETKIKIDRGLLMSIAEQQRDYQRYQISDSGLSPRPIAGRSGMTFAANSDEHDEFGFSEESAENRGAMMAKRMRKLETLAREIPEPRVYLSEAKPRSKTEVILVGWGSTKGSILEAQKLLDQEGVSIGFLHLNYLNPLPTDSISRLFASARKTLIVEQNYTAQLAGLLREKTGIEIENKLLKYDGRPIFPEEIAERVKQMI